MYQRSIDKKEYMKESIMTPGYEASGLYRGRVEDDRDPLFIGRVRVRIPMFHGVPPDSDNPNHSHENVPYILTEELPWVPVIQMGAGPQQGSYLIPEVGTTCVVSFEGNDRRNGIVLGTIYSTTSNQPKPLGSLKPGDSLGNVFSRGYVPGKEGFTETFAQSGGRYLSNPDEKEVPKESQLSPKNKVIYKSPKGASIYIIESDGMEQLVITDSAGQVFKMTSPSSVDNNDTRTKSIGNVSSIEMLSPTNKGLLLVTDSETTKLYLSVDEIISSTKINVKAGEEDA